MTDRFFTISITAGVGFTDQLMQFALLYRLGADAGLQFRLTPLHSDRSPPGFWPRYDLGRVFEPADAALLRLPRRTVDVSPKLLGAAGVSGRAGLEAYMRSVLWDDAESGPSLAVLQLRGDIREMLVALLETADSAVDRALQARLRRVFAPAADHGETQALRVACHVRCGDAADIAVLPGRAYLAWHRAVSPARETRPNAFIGARATIEALRAQIEPRAMRCAVFTDGYGRTLSLLSPEHADAYGMGASELRMLRSAVGVHADTARAAMTGGGICFREGEDLDTLAALLDAVQQADVILITGNQRMIPKFLAALGQPDRPRALLVMETDAAQVAFVRAARLTETHATLMICSPHGNPLAPLFAYLVHGPKPRPWLRAAELAQENDAGLYCITEVEALAARMESGARRADALALYRWLAVLTDGAPESLAGQARCAQALGDEPAAVHCRAAQDAAVSLQLKQAAHQASSLVSLGRLRGAATVIAEAKSRFGDSALLTSAEDYLRHRRHFAVEPERALRVCPPPGPGPRRLRDRLATAYRGLTASMFRLIGKRRPSNCNGRDAQSSKS
ncbi:MAG: hypothetical protein K9M02_07735 [Thiohalocapsa sp.]|nr:hypothetical protein [Thiohalocapsa sp.]